MEDQFIQPIDYEQMNQSIEEIKKLTWKDTIARLMDNDNMIGILDIFAERIMINLVYNTQVAEEVS
jgi:hypothetical protein